METKKQLVVVLSRNYSTGLSVVRSLGAAGYAVDLVASSYKAGNAQIVASSKYIRNWVEVVTQNVKEGAEDTALLNALLRYSGKNAQKPVLFPTDDYTTSVMDQNRSLLEDIFIMPTIVGGGDSCLTEHMDKAFQAGLARSVGLLIPQQWSVSLQGEIEIPEDMVYPCFVKPMESVSGYKKEMAKCKSEKSLRSHLQKLQKRYADRCVLVQEFLQIDNEIDFSGVCLDQEIIIPAIIKKWNVAQYEKGVTLAGKIVPAEELGDLKDKIVQMLKAFHYVGMLDMELNVVGDKIYFNEVNLRSGGPNFAYFMSGVNLPALYVKEALGEKHTS
jgi:D-alanine-D-alanine ligase-like ATP-grasp enzyme